MKLNTAGVFAVALLSGVLAAGPALAITAGDVMDKMNGDQRSSFLSGAVDMAAHLYAINGNREKADCAVNWYFRTEGSLREVYKFLDAHKDKDAVGILSILINRHCGK
jgi:hypothetical protein